MSARTTIAWRSGRALLALLLVLAATAAAADPPNGRPGAGRTITLRLSEAPSLSDRRVTTRARRAILERYLELHPAIRIHPVQGIPLEGLAGEAGIYMAFAGGTEPTVVNM